MSENQELVVRLGDLARGESSEQQFEALFRAYYPQLVCILTRISRNRGEAEELAAEAFCRLHTRYGLVRARARVAWVYRTGVNLALDALRSAAKRGRWEDTCAPQRDPIAPEANALGELLAAEERERVRLALGRLSPRHAQLLVLAIDANSYRDVARTLGLKEDSIYTLIARAKAAFEREYRRLQRSQP